MCIGLNLAQLFIRAGKKTVRGNHVSRLTQKPVCLLFKAGIQPPLFYRNGLLHRHRDMARLQGALLSQLTSVHRGRNVQAFPPCGEASRALQVRPPRQTN